MANPSWRAPQKGPHQEGFPCRNLVSEAGCVLRCSGLPASAAAPGPRAGRKVKRGRPPRQARGIRSRARAQRSPASGRRAAAPARRGLHEGLQAAAWVAGQRASPAHRLVSGPGRVCSDLGRCLGRAFLRLAAFAARWGRCLWWGARIAREAQSASLAPAAAGESGERNSNPRGGPRGEPHPSTEPPRRPEVGPVGAASRGLRCGAEGFPCCAWFLKAAVFVMLWVRRLCEGACAAGEAGGEAGAPARRRGVARWLARGLIAQRSVDRSHAPLEQGRAGGRDANLVGLEHRG